MNELEKLQKVDFRSVRKRETIDFSAWPAQPKKSKQSFWKIPNFNVFAGALALDFLAAVFFTNSHLSQWMQFSG